MPRGSLQVIPDSVKLITTLTIPATIYAIFLRPDCSRQFRKAKISDFLPLQKEYMINLEKLEASRHKRSENNLFK